MTAMASIRTRIEAQPLGEPFVSSSLLSLGPRAAVDQALTRLTKAGAILRVARGVYVLLKHANPRLLAMGTGPVGMAFAALWYMGKQQVTWYSLASVW